VAARAGLLRRLARALAWAVGLALVASVLAVLLLRFAPPFTSAFMLESRLAAWRAGDHGYRLEYRWTPWQAISRHAKLAVIASEDQKFAFHPGFDFEAIDRALREREQGGRRRGASTISQQVAKNLFLWSAPSFVRKGCEAYLTMLIELLWPKQRILEVYLNIAEFGPGVYGVGAAASHFFRTTAASLTRDQSALLAAVLPSPRLLHVARPSAYVLQRQEWIVAQMNRLGGREYIEQVEGHAER
jgi:monofunctional biosynthetic peptidoglycan transglycosylase